MKTQRINIGIILLAFLAICFFATGGILIRISKLPPIATGFYRILFSLPILFPLANTKKLSITKKEILIIVFAGVFLALDITFWNVSFHLTSVVNANLFTNMVPFIIIPVSYFLYKKRFGKIFYIGGAVALAGAIVLVTGKSVPTRGNFTGDAFALISCFFYAMYLLIVAKQREKFSALTIMFISGFGSLITLLITMLAVEGFQYPKTIPEFLPLIGLTLMLQVLGHSIFSYCMGKIGVSLSSILVFAQPVIGGIYAFVIFGEMLSVQEVIGMFIVLAGIFLAKKNFG
ncbi:MAG: DMT family transporter [Fusobacteriaceae bacterium]